MSVEPSFDLEELNKMTDQSVICCMAMRPGTKHFIMKLEYTCFPPRTEENDKFKHCIITWEGTLFFAAIIPKEDHQKAVEVATSLGMSLGEEQALLVFAGDGPKVFPVKGKHVFHLQGNYWGTTETEKEACEEILKADQPARMKWAMDRMNVGLGSPEWIDGWLNDISKFMPDCPLMIERLIATRPEIVETIVAVAERRVFGFVTICKGHGDQAYIGLIHVEQDCRRYGVGSLLLKSAMTFCVQKGLGRLRIDSRSKYLDMMLAHFPPDSAVIVEVHHLGDDLSVEQDAAEARRPHARY